MFNFELLTNKRAVVHCPNRDDAIAFVKAYRERFPGKYFLGYPGDDEYWSRYRENTCYIPNLNVNDSLKYYESYGFNIYEFCDLVRIECDIEKSEMQITDLLGL